MKKIISLLIFVVMSVAVFATFSACRPSAVARNNSSYKITAAYSEKVLTAHLDYTLVNNTDTALTAQQFLLYGRAYSKAAVHPAVTVDKAYFAGKSYGDMTVTNVTVSGAPVTPIMLGEDNEILEVKFAELFPNEKVIIGMDFVTTLATVNHRLGVTQHAVNLANWYPTACARANDGSFLAYPYYGVGDPFCTDSANYEIDLTVPKNCVVAASSAGIKLPTTAEKLDTFHYTATNVRDFAFILSAEFKTLSAQVGDTTVTYYHYNDLHPEAALKIASEALAYYGSKYGAYPFPTYAVVETGFVHGGMEYPGLVLISDATGESYNEVIVHETAHQWWYSTVGNNEVAHAWQDEGLTDYMTTLFYDAHPDYGQSRSSRIMRTLATYLTYVDVYSSLNGDVDTSMDRPLNKFKSEQEYTCMTYYKGELMFDTLRLNIGEAKFDKALKNYYSTFKFRRATPVELIACFSRSSGIDMSPFFQSWLDGSVIIA